MGLSDFKHNRTILDWPDDVIELADFMKIDRFAVEGVSGGGPYSAACAYKISNRLTGVGIVSGVYPFWDAGTTWERPQDVSDVERFWVNLSQKLPQPDRELVLDSKIMRILVEEVFEAFRQGSEGVAHEGGLYGKPWGFKLEDISSRVKVHLWHGELDVNATVSRARAMAQAIPNCEASFYPQEGHYSTALNHFEEIMRALTI
jgi:pimeloyl-ACP methyl ester carboxylesterase